MAPGFALNKRNDTFIGALCAHDRNQRKNLRPSSPKLGGGKLCCSFAACYEVPFTSDGASGYK
eukprot:8909330-Ditylum_brightwellii.AAC.1